MYKFIYVFSESDKDDMLKKGYQLLTGDSIRHTYIFVNREDSSFSEEQLPKHVMSDIITFV